VLFKQYVKDDDAAPDGDQEQKAQEKNASAIKKVKPKSQSSCGCNLNWIREKVSTNKTRLQMDEFNLDMTYITNRIIACGFPAEGTEAFYRNRRGDIVRFLQKNHGDMVKIYNLCAEPTY
jgi:hypothetical protein